MDQFENNLWSAPAKADKLVWMTAWCSARDGPGARSFHCQRAYYTRLRQGEKGRRYVY